MLSPATARDATRATYEKLNTNQQTKPSRSALTSMRVEPIANFTSQDASCAQISALTSVTFWENSDYFIE
jgi:hypothetical protein